MLRVFISRAAGSQRPLCSRNQLRGIHERNKKAMGLVAKGWSSLQEVDRVIDHADLNDPRLIPLLRAAKDNFELALEVDNMNTHARYWLSRMHFKYHVPGACKLICGAFNLLLLFQTFLHDRFFTNEEDSTSCLPRVEVRLKERKN